MIVGLLFSLLLAPLGQAPESSSDRASTARPADASALADLVASLERNNPELLAAKREIDVRAARIAPAGALPDPVLTASSMTGFARPPFAPASSTPNAFRMVSFSQDFPFPGKRALRTSVAGADADAERWNYEAIRRRLIAELKTAYLEYVLAARGLQLIADDKTLLEHLRQVAEERFSVGKGAQQDVVKAQIEISRLIERELLLQAQRDTTIAQIDALLNQPNGTPMPAALDYEAEPVPSGLADLSTALDAGDPAIRRDAALVQMNERAVSLATRNLRPDFRVGVSAERYTGEMPWMYGVDVMVSLPVYAARKQRPAIVEAGAALEASQKTRESTQAKDDSAVAQALIAAKSADQLVRLYTDSVLPQSQLALDSSLAAYQVGAVDFLSVLTNFQAVLAAQTSRLEQQVRRDQALVRLEPFVGTEFVK